MSVTTLRRTIHPEFRIVDDKSFIAEFIASDETVDSYNEIIRAAGWKFNLVQKNFPMVNSHDYSDIRQCLGRVIDYAVTAGRLVNTVKYACDVPENTLAAFAWKMMVAKYLPAVSVGFRPLIAVTKWDADRTPYNAQCAELKLPREVVPDVIYVEQEQIELSQCVIGANPNAVARAYKAGVLDDRDLEFLSTEMAKRKTADSTDGPAAVESARQRVRAAVLMEFKTKIKHI